MIDLEDRLVAAAEDLWSSVDQFDLRAEVPSVRPPRTPLVLGLLVVLATAIVGAGILAPRDSRTASGRTAPTDGAWDTATTTTEPATAPAADRVSMSIDEARLATAVAEAGRALGWTIAVPDDVIDHQSPDRGSGVAFSEVRLELGGADGELQVSIARHGADAGVDDPSRRDQLLMQHEGAEIYRGIDSNTARAVELFGTTTVVYVRSERTSDALAFDDLAAIALAVNDAFRNE